jgi:RNase P/RNase MRP subunit p30
MLDIAFPKNNEKSLLAQAKKLGSNPLFVYEPKLYKDGGMFIIATSIRDIDSARKVAKRAQFVIASSTEEKTIRKIMESKWIKFFTNIETSTGRDHTHYRRSNFNQVLAVLAKETGKTYLIDFSRLLKITDKNRTILIGRIMQNIRICQKFKVPISIVTFAREPYHLRNPRDLQALLRAMKTKKVTDVEELLNKL